MDISHRSLVLPNVLAGAPSDYSHSVGPILLGAIFNSLLLGVMIVQCQTYYTNFSCDHTRLKLLVSYLLVMNLLNTGFDIALAWHYAVNLFGNFPAVENSMWLYTIGRDQIPKLTKANVVFEGRAGDDGMH
ncbi:unnamed protein product [Rhizoctonia solani]|uniref:Uncharacterized protein n=1 Tax=Rhizoctonia solani TaxID=456999 RepID=A0A8H3BV13_9AGAM|nr:unnamed protein product [Rhizoctonia solani]